MGSAKWIGGLLGWVSGGPIGALLGYFLGSAVEKFIDAARQLPGGGYGDSQGGYGRSGSGSGGYTGWPGGYQQQTGTYRQSTGGRYTADEQRNSFFVSLLVLSSAVIKADGQVSQSELNCVREFIRR